MPALKMTAKNTEKQNYQKQMTINLRGISTDAAYHYEGKTHAAIWHCVLDAFAALRRQPRPTREEIAAVNPFSGDGLTPGEAWARIAASRKAGCGK